eukprot:5582240-Amphidinium_carterae.2
MLLAGTLRSLSSSEPDALTALAALVGSTLSGRHAVSAAQGGAKLVAALEVVAVAAHPQSSTAQGC